MPIKPENKKLYPSNWQEIRAEIKERADDKCEICGIKNHDIGIRDGLGKFISKESEDQDFFNMLVNEFNIKIIKIVCTVMHLDQDPTNNGEPGNRPNLKFGCQRCHNKHDQPFRIANRKKNKSNSQIELPETGPTAIHEQKS